MRQIWTKEDCEANSGKLIKAHGRCEDNAEFRRKIDWAMRGIDLRHKWRILNRAEVLSDSKKSELKGDCETVSEHLARPRYWWGSKKIMFGFDTKMMSKALDDSRVIRQRIKCWAERKKNADFECAGQNGEDWAWADQGEMFRAREICCVNLFGWVNYLSVMVDVCSCVMLFESRLYWLVTITIEKYNYCC